MYNDYNKIQLLKNELFSLPRDQDDCIDGVRARKRYKNIKREIAWIEVIIAIKKYMKLF